MPDYYHHVDSPKSAIVDWNIGGYPVRVPKFLADHQGNKLTWEQPRFQHMEKHLLPGMKLFDVGSEQGYMSAVYARFVGGGENMVLMEPVPQVWPNARTIWQANNLNTPCGVWCGLVSSTSWVAEMHDFDYGYRDGWPTCAFGDQLLDATKFRYEHEHRHCTDAITIDDFVWKTNIIPDAITIDVEGYEPSVIAGGIEVIRQYRPLIWVSVHKPTENNILYKFTGEDHLLGMHQTLLNFGYEPEFIGEEHEAYWAYMTAERKR